MDYGIDIPRLINAVHKARQLGEQPRRIHRQLVRHYVGPHYSEETQNDAARPLNLISLYVQIVGRNLIANNPRFLLSTDDKSQRPAVRAMQTWVNEELERLNFQQAMERVVISSMFSMGICKVGLASVQDSAVNAWGIPAGHVMVEPIERDDFVYDMMAKDWNQCGFMGHRVRVPLALVKEDKSLDPARKNLVASYYSYNREGDEKIGTLTRGTYLTEADEYEDMIDLWEIYCPRYKLVHIFTDDQIEGVGEFKEPLGTKEWIGPDWGPYCILGQGVVPGNIEPKSPIKDLIHLDLSINNVWRKLIAQSQRYKEVTFIRGGGALEKIPEMSDGDVWKCENPEGAVPVKFGGPAEPLILIANLMKQLFAYMGGNLDMMGGLEAQSNTLGQDKMLNENASKAVSFMQARTTDYVAKVGKSVMWYWWNDPLKTIKSNFSLPGLPEISVPTPLYPRDMPPMPQEIMSGEPAKRRTVPFDQLNIRIDPYSLQHSTPQSKMQAMSQFLGQLYIPMSAQAAQAGIVMDWNALFKVAADWANMPELLDLLTVQEPPMMESKLSTEPTKPQNTSREYIRKSVPTRTEKGNTLNLTSAMMGVDNGGAQKNGKPQMMGV